MILYVNTKVYEIAEYISEKVEVNPRMLSTLKKAKSIWSMNPVADFETSTVGTLGILFASVKRQIQIGQGYSKSGIFVGRPSMSIFLSIIFILAIEI